MSKLSKILLLVIIMLFLSVVSYLIYISIQVRKTLPEKILPTESLNTEQNFDQNNKLINAIVPGDQFAGMTLILRKVVINGEGFVIAKMPSGETLGTSELLTDISSDVSITLTKELTKGDSVELVLYKDINSNSVFDQNMDSLIENSKTLVQVK